MTNKQTLEKNKDLLAKAHQIFYDETNTEISLGIDRALRKICSEAQGRPHKKEWNGWHFVKCPYCKGTGKKGGEV